MRLGSDTTSYTNFLLAAPRPDEPQATVGQGATLLRRHDRLACTVVELFEDNGRFFLRVQEDRPSCAHESLNASGGPGSEHDSTAPIHVFFKSESGYWQNVAFNKKRRQWEHCSAYSLYVGERLVEESGAVD